MGEKTLVCEDKALDANSVSVTFKFSDLIFNPLPFEPPYPHLQIEIIISIFAELWRRSVMKSTVCLAHGQPSLN
jgi:hypothetical protein